MDALDGIKKSFYHWLVISILIVLSDVKNRLNMQTFKFGNVQNWNQIRVYENHSDKKKYILERFVNFVFRFLTRTITSYTYEK